MSFEFDESHDDQADYNYQLSKEEGYQEVGLWNFEECLDEDLDFLNEKE